MFFRRAHCRLSRLAADSRSSREGLFFSALSVAFLHLSSTLLQILNAWINSNPCRLHSTTRWQPSSRWDVEGTKGGRRKEKISARTHPLRGDILPFSPDSERPQQKTEGLWMLGTLPRSGHLLLYADRCFHGEQSRRWQLCQPVAVCTF